MIDAGKEFARRILANLADTKDQEISVELKVNGKELGRVDSQAGCLPFQEEEAVNTIIQAKELGDWTVVSTDRYDA